MKIRIGECLFDPESRQLLRHGQPQHLSPKAFQLLNCLLEHRPKALSKPELHQHIWPDVFVSDDSLAKLVAEIRGAIADNAREARFLRTVYGYGYAFTDKVQVLEPVATRVIGVKRWVSWEGGDAQLIEGDNIIGRDPDVDIVLDAPRVSRRHARIQVAGSDASLEDLGSKNATFLRGVRISERARLEQGDEIRIGPFVLTYRVSRPPSSTETEIR